MDLEVPIKELQQEVLKKFQKYKWDPIKVKNECDNTKNTKIVLSNTQGFIKDFFTPKNPNGILLWHSVGSGKTLTAVSVLKEFEKKGYNTLWVTRTTLKGDLQKALDMIPLSKKLIVISYKQFSNIGKSKGELYNTLLTRSKKINKSTEDPLYKTVVIIDEAHKLYTKDLKPQEMHNISSIQNMIFNSYENEMSCKVVLMSATPITSDPLEIIKLFNLIIEHPINRFDIKTFKETYLDANGKFTKEGIISFQDKIKDIVSYIDMSKDPRKFAQIEYNEILVPISIPDFGEYNPEECKEAYEFCRKNLNLPIEDCKLDLEDCKLRMKKNKQMYKSAKYQNKMLKEKCKIDFDV